jgi:hypothetical protein
MFCPKCGMEQATDSQYCRNCGMSQSVNSTSGGAGAATAPARIPTPFGAQVTNKIPAGPSKLRKSLRLVAGVLVLYVLAVIAYAYWRNSMFNQGDIAKAETDIRTNFEQRGFTVEQVSLIKESDRRLSGFVKFRKSSGLFSKVELKKDCVATMDADSRNYIWECK